MGQVHSLPTAEPAAETPVRQAKATVRAIDSVHCALCGAKLSAGDLRHHVVSPQACDSCITVCQTCHRAALGEGYRPAR